MEIIEDHPISVHYIYEFPNSKLNLEFKFEIDMQIETVVKKIATNMHNHMHVHGCDIAIYVN